VYHFASLSEEQPISYYGTSIQGIDAGLTKVCRQIRAEYLPIQRREAVVAFRWDRIEYMESWFNTFYPGGPSSSGGPRVVRLLWGKAQDPSHNRYAHASATDLAIIDEMEELLKIRAHWTSVRFEVALENSYRTSDESDPSIGFSAERDCHKLCLLLQYDDPTWLLAIRENIFDGMVIEHTARYAPPVIAVEVGPRQRYSPYYTTQRILPLEKALEAYCGMRVEVWDSSIGGP